MACRLCKKEFPLKKSHIIPEFLYASMYDEKHRFHKISTSEGQRNRLVQKGLREYLLCGNCEQKLSRYERYTSLILNGGTPITCRQDGNCMNIEGVEYARFKLCALSILWRASVSSLDFFNQVELGPDEETLREMIFNEDPGKQHNYPFILYPIVHEDMVQEDLIVQPERIMLADCIAYRFIFGGIAWVFVVRNHQAPDVIASASISESGRLVMLPKRLTDMRFLVSMAQDLTQQGIV